MKKLSFVKEKLKQHRKHCLMLMAFLTTTMSLNAQVVSTYSFGQSTGTYTPITGGTSMELASTSTSGFDSQLFHNGTGGINGTTTAGTYNAFPIGFNFIYRGVSYNGFYIGTDGYIKLGSTTGTATAGSSTPISSTTSGTDDLISAFGVDLAGGMRAVAATRTSGSPTFTLTGTSTGMASNIAVGMRILGTGIPAGTTVTAVSGTAITMSANATASSTSATAFFVESDNISYSTTGTAGSRVLTVQWKNCARYSGSGDLLNFQIKLYEGTNVIQTMYNNTASTQVTASSTVEVGLKGLLTPADYNNRAGTATTGWAATTAGTSSSATIPFRGAAATGGAVVPASGLIFTWTPPTCIAPTALTIVGTSITTSGATASWTAPLSAPSNGYEVYYSTSNVAPTSTTVLDATNSVTSTTASAPINGLSPGTTYYVWVRSFCGGTDRSIWTAASSFTTYCLSTNVPYTLDFTSVTAPALPTCTSAVNYGSGNIWITYSPAASTGFTGNVLNYTFNGSNAANTWFFTQGINLTAGTSYRIKYKYGNASAATYPEKLKVAYGTSATNTGMTNTLADYPNVVNSTAANAFVDFIPATTGVYFFGFQAYSVANMNRLYVDDINIDLSPSCADPTALIVTAGSVTSSGASVSWTAPAAAPSNGYEVYYSTSNVAPTATTVLNATNSVTSTTTSASISGLAPATAYYVWVRSVCSTTDKSIWSLMATFTTQCNATNVPYAENFDTTAVGSSTNTNAPTCWKYLEPTGWGGYGYVSTTAFTSSPNGYYIYTDTATTGGGMLVSPQTTNLTNGSNRVRFSANGGGSGYTMEVGTLSDPNDATTFVAIGSPISLTTTMATYIVNIPSGTSQYLAFRHAGGGSSRSIRLDDIFVEVAPSCLEPTAIVTSNITNAGATIGWTASTTVPSNGYEVYYSTSNVAPTATTVLNATNSVTSTTTSAPISGLSAATVYYVWVRSACSTTDKSVWSLMATFTTQCNATNVPYAENFDTTAVGSSTNTNAPTCWKYLEPAGWGGYGYVSTTAFTSSPNGYYIYTDTATTGGGMLVSPQTTNLTNGSNRVRFSANGGGSGYTMEVGTLSDPNDATTFVAIGSPISLTTTMATYIVNIPSGTSQYLAFRHAGGGSSRSIRLDDIFVEVAPSCLEPTAIVTSNITNAGATIGWTASTTVPSNGYEVYYSTSNTAPTATTVLDATNSVTSTTTSAPISGLAPATVYYVWVRSACSTTDKSVWSLMATFTTQCNATNVPYILDFTNVTTPALPNCASAVNYGNGNTWITYATTATGFSGNVLNYTYNSSNAANTWFFTQGINLTAGTAYRIQYKYGNNGGTTYPEKLKVAYGSSAVNTAMTNQLADHGNITNTTAISTFVDFTPTTTGVYYFGFQAYSAANMNRLFVDDINIDVAPTCLEPTSLAITAGSVTASGATVSWTAPSQVPANGYDVYVGTTSTAPTASSTPTYPGVTATTQAVTGTSGTTYYVWVRSKCSASENSAWAGPVSFTLLTPPPANDVCSGAIALIPGANFAQNAITTTNVGATTDGTTSCQNNRGDNVWYTVVVPASGNITVETQSVAGSGLLDTVLSVHSGTCGGTLTSIACDDDSSTDGSFSLVSLTGQTPGATLYVSVWRYTGTIGGASTNGQFKLSAYDASLSTSESVKSKNEIKAYPNPFADVLNISDISNVKSISVVDISGKLVKTFDKPESTLHLRELNSGMYLVILNMKDGSKQAIKAIKK